jgi:hypothetical protein
VDVWKQFKPAPEELNDTLNYHIERSKNITENNVSGEELSKLNSITLQDYLEMLIDVVQDETGPWFFYVDIAGILFDQVQAKKIYIYQSDSGYVVIFEK